jgi:hypothetical protein
MLSAVDRYISLQLKIYCKNILLLNFQQIYIKLLYNIN